MKTYYLLLIIIYENYSMLYPDNHRLTADNTTKSIIYSDINSDINKNNQNKCKKFITKILEHKCDCIKKFLMKYFCPNRIEENKNRKNKVKTVFTEDDPNIIMI